MSRRSQIALSVTLGLALAGALAFALLASIGGSSKSSSTTAAPPAAAATPGAEGFDGAALPGGIVAPDFALTDQYGRPVSVTTYAGRVRVIAIVSTTCGAPCVLIAQQIRGALDELPRPVPVLLVSADPGADGAAAVRHFLAQVSLSGRVHYLTGSASALAPIWREYRLLARAGAGVGALRRSASVLLVDRAGRERVLFGPEQLTPEALAHDIGKLEAG